MKQYIIGVDGGNTKTDYLLYDIEGNFIDGIRSGTCSHEGLPDTFDGAYRVMKENILALLNRNHLDIKDVSVGTFGLAGVDCPYQQQRLEDIVERIGFNNYKVVNDGFLGIKAASPDGTGVCSINGTGTVSVGFDQHHNSFQVGGVGYVAGDEAGGSFLARAVVRSVYDASFRFGPNTALINDVFTMYAINDKLELRNAIIMEKVDSKFLVQALCQRANENDKVAVKILATAGENMARSISGVVEVLDFNEHLNIILAGSVWAKATSIVMLNRFKEVIKELTDFDANYIILEEPPVLGAIIWALELANGHHPTKEIKQKLKDSINDYQKRF